MQTYIVRVQRARPGTIGPVSGIVEDIESGQKEVFQNFDELQTMLGHSIARGQLGFSDFTTQQFDTHVKLSAIK
jgi:hypothetical protein